MYSLSYEGKLKVTYYVKQRGMHDKGGGIIGKYMHLTGKNVYNIYYAVGIYRWRWYKMACGAAL